MMAICTDCMLPLKKASLPHTHTHATHTHTHTHTLLGLTLLGVTLN